MHLRQPILLSKKGPLRALIPARFSTEEQRQSSIDDQVASCRTFLESHLPKGWKPEQVEIDVIAEPEVSGEIADRPGINQVWAGIEANRWHLIIAEESSRLYRHHTKAGELFESAVDADVRVICTSDYIDTADDEWLDSIKFAKAKWSRQAKWTAGNVNAVIRRTIYRGFETFRKKKAKRKLRTGKSEYVWNDEDKIQTRESPHLRIASDHLWYAANEVVDKRRVFQKPVRGVGHPLRGTTRQRRGLLAGVFNCGVCGSPMYSYGKQDGSFRCSASATGKCWNRVYCMRERVYPAVLEAVVNEVPTLDGVRDAVLARVKELHEKGGAVAAELKKLDREEKRLVAGIERLSAAVESGDGALVSLTARLAEREQELVIVRARRREVEEQAGRKEKLPSEAKLLEHLGAVKGQLVGDESRVAVILRQLLEVGRPHGRWQTPPGFLTSGTRGRRRWLRLRSPDFMAGGGLPLPGVLDDGREIVSKLFRDASPSRVNVFDRRVAIRRFLCHRSATPPACR